ncbi:SDR family NAD(P)-dependent oxidoreductase [Streptomyces misionensis]|uniref:SDR family NAD(P)-dependent oxidoreductase n=1 Tax=Streptomyces misionensis TaxID=67331 RepID=UPI00382BC75F
MSWPAGEAAFVTGAASGIGLGIARALVANGAKVALADIDRARLDEVARELTEKGGAVTTVVLDVSDAEQWAAAADRAEEALGPISILCNNAGVNGGGMLDQTPLKVWRWIQRINVEGQFIGISTFLPRMKSRGGRGHILNTASMAGLLPIPGVGAYTASKFASVGLSMVLRAELAQTELAVSLLCPGAVATRISATSEEGQAKVLGRDSDVESAEQIGAMLAQGADPDHVGEQVVEAMQNKEFLIVTHRDYLPLVENLHVEIQRAFADFDGRHGADPTAQAMAQAISAGAHPVSS